MASREDLQEWILEALEHFGGEAKLIDICKFVWLKHSSELERSGDLLFTWQYDIRWAGTKLRHAGKLDEADRNSVW